MGNNKAVIVRDCANTHDAMKNDIGSPSAQENALCSGNKTKSASSRFSGLSQFIEEFCSIGGYSEEEMAEFLLAAETTNGITISAETDSLSIKCLPSDSLCTLLSFRMDIASAEVFLDIDELNADLIKAGRFPSEASDYIRFVRGYASEHSRDDDRIIFLNVFHTLENPRVFANAFSELAYHLRER